MCSLPKYIVIKGIIPTLATIMFRLPKDIKQLLKTNDIIIMEEKLVVITINPLVYYIFLKVCL